VAALTFVKHIFDTKGIKREISAHFNLFFVLFRGNSMVFLFLIISCSGNEVFLLCKSKKQRLQRVPVSYLFSHACQSKLGRFSQATLDTALAVVFNMPLHILM
jgi:hypothetical protein